MGDVAVGGAYRVRERTGFKLCVWGFLVYVGLLGCNGGDSLPEYRGAALAEEAATTQTAPKPRKRTLTDQVLTVAARVTAELGDSVLPSASSFSHTLDTITMRLSSRLFMQNDPRARVSEIVTYIFEEQEVVFDRDDNDPRNMFPHTVLARQRGSCLGMSLLVLALAERLDVSMHGVLAPGHLFVRCRSGSTSFNVETIKKGESFEDSWYHERYDIKAGSRYEQLRSLSDREVIAVLLYNVGNALLERERYEEAVRRYELAVTGMPSYAEAWGNMGIALEALGEQERALEALEKARTLDPSLHNLSSNIAAVAARLAKHEQAIQEYSRAVSERPDDPEVLYGLAYACLGAGRYTEARMHAQRVLELRGTDPNASHILQRVRAAQGSVQTN